MFKDQKNCTPIAAGRMRTKLFTLAGIATLCSTAAFAQMGNTSGQAAPTANQTVPQTPMAGMDKDMAAMTPEQQQMMDRQFVHKALEGGMAEVELGQLALTKSSDPDVKSFAQKMVDDHSKLGDDMKMVAQQQGVNIPKKLSKKDMALKAKLSALDGAAFDKSYIKDMVKDHEQDEADFKDEIAKSTIPQIKDAAMNGEKVISMHLDMVKQLAESHGVKPE